LGCFDQTSAANPAAWGAAADVPEKATGRIAVAKGTGATKSGLSVEEFPPPQQL
jgi:hypothetical protein